MSFLPTDIPDLRGYDSGVVLSNLSRLRTREERLGEQILAQLWELAGFTNSSVKNILTNRIASLIHCCVFSKQEW